jgi:Beta-lactamase enzyme family
MAKHSHNHSEQLEKKVSELKDKLNRANQIISSLQQQNLALKQQVNKLVSDDSSSKVIAMNNDDSLPPTPNSQTNSNTSKKKLHYKNYIAAKINKPQMNIKRLSKLQFYGLTGLVTLIIISIFGISSIFANRNSQKNLEPAKNRPINKSFANQNYPQTSLNLTNTPIAATNNSSKQTPIVEQTITALPQAAFINSEFVYNVTTPPQFKSSDKLDGIVKTLVELAKEHKTSTDNLSITVIDLNKNTIGEYQGNIARFPASVVKIFWLVALKTKILQGVIPLDASANNDINKLIIKSDNDAASNIIDRITSTQTFTKKLDKEQFKQWKYNRESLNLFFQKADYININISQKTFPIPHLNIQEPQGTDLQIRGDNPNKPIRNKVTTHHAARLMYEIVTGQAITPQFSNDMKDLLSRDLRSWQSEPLNPEEFHPVKNFLGESLPADKVEFASKAGWTTKSRQEVAYVATKDGKTRYIIAVFGDDKTYGQSRNIFPKMSRLVFDRMTN